MRVIFFGTPSFAVPSLKRLLQSRHSVKAVVTQPDRPQGRFLKSASPPVKEAAEAAGIPIFQPDEISDPEFLTAIHSQEADLAVVVAYGRILPSSLIHLFPKGAINLHASLLPKLRGAAPIQWALIRGELETGVTVFQIDELLDHGPILLQERCPIHPEDTNVSLSQTLAELGGRVLLKTADLIETGSVVPRPQDEKLVTHAPRLAKTDGIIDWRQSCESIHNRIRGVQPWPGTVISIGGRQVKLLSTVPAPSESDPAAEPGAVVMADPNRGLWIQTGAGQIRVDRLQPAGGIPLEASAFLRGHPVRVGTRLVSSTL